MKNKLTATLPLALLAIGMLGSVTSVNADDLNNSIFVPVNPPCRVGDTRGTSTPSIPADGHVEWFAYGTDMSDQGGNAAGCPQPKAGMTPTGISVNIAVYGPQAEGRGNLVAYPADASAPTAAILNYYPVPTDLFPSPSISNSTIVSLCQEGACDGKFKIQANNAAVPVIADVQGYFYARPSGVAQVAVRGGDYSSPVDAMNDLDKWCGTPSATNQCLMKIAPGNYVVDATPVVMQEWVSIQGSGKLTTIITGAVSGDAASGLLHSVDNASLTDLTIQNIGGSGADHIIGIQNRDASPLIQRVNVEAFGGLVNTGIRHYGLTSYARIRDVDVLAEGGNETEGISIDIGARLNVKNSRIVAKGASKSNKGVVYNMSGIHEVWDDMRNVSVTAEGGTIAIGVEIFRSVYIFLESVTVHASGGTKNFGVRNLGSRIALKDCNISASGTDGFSIYIDSSSDISSLVAFTAIQESNLHTHNGAKSLYINSPFTRLLRNYFQGDVVNLVRKNLVKCTYNVDADYQPVNCH